MWLLSVTGRRTAHRVSADAACIVILGAAPIVRAQLIADAADAGVDAVAAGRLVAWLENRDYVVPADRPDVIQLIKFLDTWATAGWRAASQYHLQTYGYEFETYLADGTSRVDATRMRDYAALQPDIDRGKSYGTATREASLPVPSPAQIVPPPSASGVLDRAAILAVIAMTGGIVRTAPLPWPGAEPALRKTSPSGGSRHPTELYAHAWGVPGLADAWYHFDAVGGRLEPITGTTRSRLRFANVEQPSAVVVFTSLFERNRYRYREPRTFRTVHMDVGHLMETCALVAEAHGLRTTQHLSIDENTIAAELRLDPVVECPISAISFASSLTADGAE